MVDEYTINIQHSHPINQQGSQFFDLLKHQ
ncbi:MAG: hypothetical protein K0S31_3048 [Sphingobacterium multivorum]|nr:hypothetical protein [Sphingobacterium multivorum]